LTSQSDNRRALISRVKAAAEDRTGVALSVTVNVYVLFGTTVVGVPLRVPVAASSVSPVGKLGVTDHFSGEVPPVACKVFE
jgi:hypothetical protein